MNLPPFVLITAAAALGLVFGALATLLWQRQQQGVVQQALRAAVFDAERARDLASQRSELLEAELAAARHELEALRADNSRLLGEESRLKAALEHQQRSSEEKLQLLTEAREQLRVEFERLAGRIFEDKQAKFSASSRETLEQSLNPLREQLGEFRKRMDVVYDSENRDRSSLRQELKNLQELNQRISKEALNLTRALKGDSKAQGNWGEVILERVLEESGLHKGREYETQASFTDEQGRRRQPDVIVHLPENKDIVIDAKVSLVAYERYCSAEEASEKQAALAQHIASVKKHIDGLSFKAYENIEGIRTLDFVFIFIPIEAAFMAAFEHDPEVFRSAYEKNIIVVSPTTLLATLRTVQSIWRYERQNRNAELIAKEAGALHDQFARVLESLEDVGRFLDKGRESYEKTLDRLTRGRGNMANRVSKLQKLGAKVKKQLPASVTARMENGLDELSSEQDD